MKLRSLIYQSVLWRSIYFGSVLLLNIAIARYFEASNSGLIFFVTNSFALIVTLSTLSMESGVSYYVASGEVSLPKLINFSFCWIFFSIIVGFFLMPVFIHFNLIPSSYTDYLLPAFCYLTGCLLVNFFATAFYSKKNFALPNLLLALVNIILLILVPFSNGFLFSFDTYADIYFSGFLLQGVLVAVFFYIQYGDSSLFGLPEKWEVAKIVRYGMTAFLANILFFLVYKIDYWFVESYCSLSALGNYIQASKLSQTLFILPSIVATAVFPAIIKSQERRLGEKVATIARVLLLIFLFICLVLTATGYWLFPFVFGETFKDMYVSFLLMMPGIMALSVLFPVTAYYAGVKKIRVNVICLSLTLVVIITGNMVLTPRYGINGAAVVSSIGYIAYHLFIVSFFLRENTISYSRFYRVRWSDFSKLQQMVLNNRKSQNETKQQ